MTRSNFFFAVCLLCLPASIFLLVATAPCCAQMPVLGPSRQSLPGRFVPLPQAAAIPAANAEPFSPPLPRDTASDGIVLKSVIQPVNFDQPLEEAVIDESVTITPESDPAENPSLANNDPLVDLDQWMKKVKVGYDRGFLIASDDQVDLSGSGQKFRLRINGWGQLRNTLFESDTAGRDIRQFQLKRARVVFSGNAFTPDFEYFIQVDGRSSDGDDLRLLDYYLNYDVGHHFLNLDKNRFAFRTGRWKMPFTLARYLSGREFEFSDRSVASMYFDVNRSLAWGLYGVSDAIGKPIDWEVAIFNGLVTGGAETGSSGTLDSNFAYSGRVFSEILGEWGRGQLADLDYHETPAARIGAAIATSTIDRVGTTEFSRVRVVDTGARLVDILPASVDSYRVFLYSADLSVKYRGWSVTNEYYFRTIDNFRGAPLPRLFDHGHWLQVGKFIIPEKLQVLARWSRVDGNSGSLGAGDLASREVGAAVAYYFRGQNAKIVWDAVHLNGAPINSAALDIQPGNDGWLFRTQIQYAF